MVSAVGFNKEDKNSFIRRAMEVTAVFDKLDNPDEETIAAYVSIIRSMLEGGGRKYERLDNIPLGSPMPAFAADSDEWFAQFTLFKKNQATLLQLSECPSIARLLNADAAKRQASGALTSPTTGAQPSAKSARKSAPNS